MTAREEARRHSAGLRQAYLQAMAAGKRPTSFLAVAGALDRAAAEIGRLLEGLQSARERLVQEDPHADTRDLDALLLSVAPASAPTPLPVAEPGAVALPEVLIDYTNWRGERAERLIRPVKLWWGKTEFHPEPQFLLTARDVEKNAERDFAMADIHAWTSQPGKS